MGSGHRRGDPPRRQSSTGNSSSPKVPTWDGGSWRCCTTGQRTSTTGSSNMTAATNSSSWVALASALLPSQRRGPGRRHGNGPACVRALFPGVASRGRIVGLDYSRKMLTQAAQKTRRWADRITLIWEDASRLPFPPDIRGRELSGSVGFITDPTTCLPRWCASCVLGDPAHHQPHGNDAADAPADLFSRDDRGEAEGLALEMVQVRPWQVEYDLVYGHKARLLHPGPRKGHRCRAALPGVWRRSDAAR